MDYESTVDGTQSNQNKNMNTKFRRSVFVKQQWFEIWSNIKFRSNRLNNPNGYNVPLSVRVINPYIENEVGKLIMELNKILKK